MSSTSFGLFCEPLHQLIPCLLEFLFLDFLELEVEIDLMLSLISSLFYFQRNSFEEHLKTWWFDDDDQGLQRWWVYGWWMINDDYEWDEMHDDDCENEETKFKNEFLSERGFERKRV